MYAAVLAICLLILAAAAFEIVQLRANVPDRIQGKTKNIAISVTQTMDAPILAMCLPSSVDLKLTLKSWPLLCTVMALLVWIVFRS